MPQSIRIGSQILPHDPFWVQVREAAEQRARELGIVLVPLATDLFPLSGEVQVQMIEEFLANELDALIISNISDQLALHILESGLPLIAHTERDLTHPLLISPVGLYDAAQMAGQFLAKQLLAHGRILLVGGISESVDFAHTRIKGFTDQVARFADISVTQIPTRWRYQQACTDLRVAVEQDASIAAHGPFDGVFGLSDSIALAVRDVGGELTLINDRTQIVGLNGDPLALSAILDGSLAATVETSADDLGHKMVQYAYDAALGKRVPNNFNYRISLVTADNVAEVAIQKLSAIASLPTRLVGVNRRQEQQRLRQMETALEINRRIGLFLDWPELSQGLAEVIRTNYEYDHVQIFLWDEPTQSLILNPLTVGTEHSTPNPQRILVSQSEKNIVVQALLRNQCIFVPDAHTSQRFTLDPLWPDTRSRVILPIRLGQTILGVMDLHSRRVTQHSQVELDALQLLADQTGVAIRNSQLYAAAQSAGVDVRTPARFLAASPINTSSSTNELDTNKPGARESGANKNTHVNHLVQQTLAYIHANFASTISREHIADEIGVSPDYITRLFRETTGRSPWQYLIALRVQRAAELLQRSSISITEVGVSVGFNDPAYFSRTFRKEMGLSPQQYRQRLKS